jgi:hypothetical protein
MTPAHVRYQQSRQYSVKVLHPGVVSVVRPNTKWQNPFPVRSTRYPDGEIDNEAAVRRFVRFIIDRPELVPQIRADLGGRDLMCYCAEAEPWCHADVLLFIAAGGEPADYLRENR